jgi:hypothetical protein
MDFIKQILFSSCNFFSTACLRTSPQQAASRFRKAKRSPISASVKPQLWACLMNRMRRAEFSS